DGLITRACILTPLISMYNSDALQTTVAFTIPVRAETMPDLEIYKDGVKIKSPSFTTKPKGDKTQF
ncbi:MAG: hypothetical protein ACTIDA_09065, partial [Pseudolactococcus laudensis]